MTIKEAENQAGKTESVHEEGATECVWCRNGASIVTAGTGNPNALKINENNLRNRRIRIRMSGGVSLLLPTSSGKSIVRLHS